MLSNSQDIPHIQDPQTMSDLPEPVIPPDIVLSACLQSRSDFGISSLSVTEPSGSNLTTHSRRVSGASDISDVSDVSVDENSTSVYDVESETAPIMPFFSPTFQRSLKEGLEIAQRTTIALEKLKPFLVPGSRGGELMADGMRFSSFRGCDTRTIALLGDSGEAGKSSLINSLLHFPDIAATGDLGAACTPVVTEYRKLTIDQSGPIAIEIEYLSADEIDKLIGELIWNYRQPFLPMAQGNGLTDAEYVQCQRESDQAWSALEAAFKHQSQFKEEFLSDMSDGALERVTERLTLWARDIPWPEGDDGTGKWSSSAQSVEECYEKTKAFMEDRLWPFTKIIRIYLDAPILNGGIVLADLPGLQDTNLARVQATQKYLMRCDNIFLVTNIARAITDSSLKSSIYNVISRHVPAEWEKSAGKNLKLAVVCTKSESINQRNAEREFCGPGKKIPRPVLDNLDRDIRLAKANDDQTLKKELKRRQLLLIDARNCHVKNGLQSAYKMLGGNLEVFCVSNTMYEKFSSKPDSEGARRMIDGSGIPELRRFCLLITAEARLVEAKHFLQSSLSSLLSSIDIWANIAPNPVNGGDDDDPAVWDIKIKEIERVDAIIMKASSEFNDAFDEQILRSFHYRNDHWAKQAKEEGNKWADWPWTQYNAWCIKNGDHCTPRRGRVNWNNELIWKMRIELESQWELLEEEVPTTFKKLRKSVIGQIHGLEKQLQSKGCPPTLIKSLHYRIQDIKYRFSLIQRDFASEIHRLTRGMASEPSQSSYIVMEMLPAYRSASQEKGTGKAARQRRRVQGRIEDGTLFPNISFAIASRIQEAIVDSFALLCDVAQENFGRIMKDTLTAAAQWKSIHGSKSYAANRARKEAEEEERLKKAELAHEIAALKVEHKRILEDISGF
ncbi:hypothetical protein MGYG_08870 [Nannizzia gypsea CBS 118893]|uniref:Uncharacterized protein n=1 Tax=Arthroderma gypseum (strain ATCC MYA-4604 / CBS 118893) TaxID=535722 RepID=E4V779_ARTGP|nr:hypothetical protein MGYG_08870 [Nannizzia gypsea CBS 118893]EFQ96945.1 hypothetical protein MGYG_08870 [Nannizzia gypsea CBS 118893]